MGRRGALVVAAIGLVLAASCVGGSEAGTPPATTPDLTSSTAPEPLGEFPAQPTGVPWPTLEWAEAQWPEGADRVAVDEATDLAFADGAAERVRSVAIVHGGALVYERYSPNADDGPEVVMPSYSVAKSICSALIGMLVRDQRLDIDEPARVPEWHEDPDDPRAEITTEHLLHMASGMPWNDDFTQQGTDMYEMVRSNDAAAYAAAQRSSSDPGETFDYNSGSSTLLARTLSDEVGTSPDDVRAYMDDELFDKIGMDHVRTDFDPAGTWQGAYSADSTLRDFAKFGLLYLRGGEWDGERILTEEWVEFSRTPSPANPEYGAHWWLDPERPGVFYAIGIRGQIVTVDPANDLVIVQLSTVGGDLPLAHTEAMLDAFLFVES